MLPRVVQQGTVPVSIKQEFKMAEMCSVKFNALMLCCPRLVDTGNYKLDFGGMILEIKLPRRCCRVSEQGEAH